MKPWFKKLLIIVIINIIYMFPLACHHHDNGTLPPPPAPIDNPADYTYTATQVTQHQPGFFSSLNNNGVITCGTYMDYNHKHDMQAQFCVLENGKIRVVKVIHGIESIYNIRPINNNSNFLACEQGSLLGAKTDGTIWKIHNKHLGMGHYQGQWWYHDGIAEWVTTEKDTISASNRSQIWVGDKLLYESSDFTWKEFDIKDNTIYLAAYYIWKRKAGGILTVNLKTGEPNLIYFEEDGWCLNVVNANGEIRYTIQHNNTTNIFRFPHELIQTIPDIAWRFSPSGIFLLAAEHGWRKAGPSYLYVWDTVQQKYILKLQLKDAEPWSICPTNKDNAWYLFTRNEKEGNLGRVYLIERHK